MQERLLLVRWGIRHWSVNVEPLRPGAAGNEQTLRYAAQWVREDSPQPWLRAFAERLTAGCASPAAAVAKLFEFARDQIRYVEDPPATERIADAWRTIEKREGDCGDKSILLATLLGSIGINSRFIVQSWDGDLSNGYDHVLVQAFVNGGLWMDLDPTPERAVLGWSAPDRARAVFEIWPEGEVVGGQRVGMQSAIPNSQIGLGGFLDDFGPELLQGGIQFGTQFGASQLQQSRLSDQQGAAIGAQFENLVSQAYALFQNIAARLPYITAADLAIATEEFQKVESFVRRYPTQYVQEQWNSTNYKQAGQNYLTQFRQALAQQQAAVGSGLLAVDRSEVVSTIGNQQLSIGGIQISGLALAGVAALVVLLLLKR